MPGISTAGLSGVEETAFITLHARALDARSEPSILRDSYAVDAVAKVDYDWRRLQPNPKLDLKERLNVAIRAVQFDEWVRDFVARNADAIVLDLGCGLDSRALRVNPPPGVDWYNVDFPAMIALHERLYETTNVHRLATSLDEEDWLEQLPAGRPVVVVLDGVYPFLRKSSFIRLLKRVTGHFEEGEILLLGFSTLSSKMMTRVVPAIKALGVPINEGFNDPRDVERWNPDLRLAEQRRLIDSPELAKAPRKVRVQSKIMRSIPGLAKADKGMLRYTFRGETR